jgi:hypothetical protein
MRLGASENLGEDVDVRRTLDIIRGSIKASARKRVGTIGKLSTMTS